MFFRMIRSASFFGFDAVKTREKNRVAFNLPRRRFFITDKQFLFASYLPIIKTHFGKSEMRFFILLLLILQRRKAPCLRCFQRNPESSYSLIRERRGSAKSACSPSEFLFQPRARAKSPTNPQSPKVQTEQLHSRQAHQKHSRHFCLFCPKG